MVSSGRDVAHWTRWRHILQCSCTLARSSAKTAKPAAASGRRSRFDRAESVAAAGTADAAVVNHCFTQIGTVHFRRSGVLEYATIFDPSRPCSLLSDNRALHTDDSWSPEVDAGDLPPPVDGATGAGHVCILRAAPRWQAPLLYRRTPGPSEILLRGPSLSPTVHRPALRGASRWFLPRSTCPNKHAQDSCSCSCSCLSASASCFPRPCFLTPEMAHGLSMVAPRSDPSSVTLRRRLGAKKTRGEED